MDQLEVHEPNQLEGSTDARRLGRRSWLKMVGALGLLSVGGYALATGLRSPGPRWIAPLPAPAGYGSAAADDGTLYVHVRDHGGAGTLLALDGATGAQRWTTRLDTPREGDVVMIAAGEDLVVGTSETVSVHDTATGTLRWQVPASAAVDVADGVVVTRSSDGVIALDVRTGDLLWNVKLTSPDNSAKTSADVAAHNGMCVVVNAHLLRTESGLHSMTWIDSWDLRTGQPVWSTSTDVEESFGSAGMRIQPSGDRVVVASAPEGSLVLEAATGRRLSKTWAVGFAVVGDVLVHLEEGWTFAEVKGVDLADRSVRWSQTVGSSEWDPDFDIVAGDGYVYVSQSGGTPVALDAASGATRWTYRGQHADSRAAVIAARGRDVYVVAGSQIEAFTIT
ncbi:PQQ-binding-like beta-propeller repeat protein [Pseudonocardia hierapolitana]|nr:PQQ-binding-like beta-propeller repeat protein [Pseudonocardia hierapolitana]